MLALLYGNHANFYLHDYENLGNSGESKWWHPAENATIDNVKYNVAKKQECLAYFRNRKPAMDSISGVVLNIIRWLITYLYNNNDAICLIFITFVFIYWIYKSYWSPLNIVKELTNVGFCHIPPGKHRSARVARARINRKLGENIPPPYPNGWFAILEAAEVAPGEVKAVDALGENLAVYRDGDNVVRIVDAYCPHLGANMGVGGRVSNGCIECPFHKWRFDGESGECVSVPGQETPIRGVKVRTWYSDEVDHIIWVWYSSERGPPAWRVTPASDFTSRWRFCGKNDFVVNSHIQDIPENGADVAHLNAIHSISLFASLESGERFAWLQHILGRHTWEAAWKRGDGHLAHIDIKHDYQLFEKISLLKMHIKAVQIGPGLVQLQTRSMLIIQTVTPLGPLEQRVIHRIYAKAPMVPFATIFLLGETIMFERDVKMWNNKRFVSSPAYSKQDKTIKTFRNWYSQFYSEQSLTFKDALAKQNRLEW